MLFFGTQPEFNQFEIRALFVSTFTLADFLYFKRVNNVVTVLTILAYKSFSEAQLSVSTKTSRLIITLIKQNDHKYNFQFGTNLTIRNVLP